MLTDFCWELNRCGIWQLRAANVLLKMMKIAVVDIEFENAKPIASSTLLPKLLLALASAGDEIYLWTKGESYFENEASNVAARKIFFQEEPLNEASLQVLTAYLKSLKPDVYLLWNSPDVYWNVLPLLEPQTAVVAVGHADAEAYYRPVRHYRPFLTRLVGTTPEVCVGFVINCVIEKEKVEWIGGESPSDEFTDLHQIIESYRNCLKNAQVEAQSHPRAAQPDFSLLTPIRRSSFFSLIKNLSTKW